MGSQPSDAADVQGHTDNIYLQSYKNLLDGLSSKHTKSSLLSTSDLDLVDSLRGAVSNTPPFAVFSRLVLRKGDWLRFDRADIVKYLEPFKPSSADAVNDEEDEEGGGGGWRGGEEDLAAGDAAAELVEDPMSSQHRKPDLPAPPPPVDIDEIMTSLQSLQIVDLITTTSSSSSSDESIFDAIASCLSSDELKSVYRKMDKTALKVHRKDEVLLLLRKQCKSQRGISGFFAKAGAAASSSNSGRLLKAICEVLQQKNSSSSSILFFRVKPSVLLLLRRGQRLQQLSTAHNSEGCSVYSQSPNNLDLLVRFKKLSFPKYSILITEPIFLTRRMFEQWEYSMEIKFALTCLLPPSPNGTIGSNFSFREKIELKNMFQCFAGIFVSSYNKVIGVRFDDLERLGSHVIAEASSGGMPGLDEGSTALALEYVFLLSIVAFVSYTTEQQSTCSSSSSRPQVFAQFEAGAALADALCTAAAVFETRKGYSYAIHIFLLLLDCSYYPHRRGNWYIRLSIDLEHQGRLQSSLAATQRGLSDRRVKPADRITLQNRSERTQGKIKRKEEKRGGEGILVAEEEEGCLSLLDGHMGVLIGAVNDHISSSLALAACSAPSSSSNSSRKAEAHTGVCLDCTFQNATSARECCMCSGTSFRPLKSTVGLAREAPDIILIDDDEDASNDIIDAGGGAVDGCDKENSRNVSLDVSISEPSAAAVLEEAVEEEEGFLEQLLSTGSDSTGGRLEQLKTVTIGGRRFGENRVGKNRFLSETDRVLTVESYVLEKCLRQDDCDDGEEFRNAVRGGGWGGWHCEGSPLRSLFNLLMWDCIYCTVPNVFINAYQEAPLDLPTALFYSNRKAIIDARVEAIAAASQEELLGFVASAFSAHFKEKALCICWRHQLKVLQLIALCVGAKSLAELCKLFCCNYKQFCSGFPDLLLVRLTSTDDSFVELGDVLGEEWDSLSYNIFESADRKRGRSSGGLTEGDDLADDPQGGRRKFKRGVGGFVNGATSGAADNSYYDEFNDRPLEREAAERAARELRRERIKARERHLRAELGDTDRLFARVRSFECVVIEVKGPADHLSDKQVLWLQVLGAVGVEAMVVRVKEGL